MQKLLVGLLIGLLACSSHAGAQVSDGHADEVVEGATRQLMQQQDIPGMAVALVRPEGTAVFNFGVAERGKRAAVDDKTLFEVGSLSKLFTASLASLAVSQGKLDPDAPVSQYLPELKGSAFDDVTALNLATYTAGGLPLFVPEHIADRQSLIAWYRDWQPTAKPGESRTYSNPSIGLLGLATAAAMHRDFVDAMRSEMFEPLGLRHTWYRVPQSEMAHYAMGEDKKGQPARLSPGVVADQAYGIKSTAGDLAALLQANLGLLPLDSEFQTALNVTRRHYAQVGDMTQGMVWEAYALPVALETLLVGNSYETIVGSHATDLAVASQPPADRVWVNKTGSSNGFGAYVVMVPSQQIGLVMLANKNYPNEARVRTAFAIFSELGVL
jgi:beta-lactamase class C